MSFYINLYFLSLLITVNQMSYPWDVIKLHGETIIWWGRLELSLLWTESRP